MVSVPEEYSEGIQPQILNQSFRVGKAGKLAELGYQSGRRREVDAPADTSGR
jgi:hypothetical protein